MARPHSKESAEMNFVKMHHLREWVNEQMQTQCRLMHDLDSTWKQLASIDGILQSLETIMLAGGKPTEAVVVELMHDIKLIMHVSIKNFQATHVTSWSSILHDYNNWQNLYYKDTMRALSDLGLRPTQSSSSSSYDNELNFDNNWLFVQLSPSSADNPHSYEPDCFIAIDIAEATAERVPVKSATNEKVLIKPPPVHVFMSDAGFAACTFAESSIFLYGGLKFDGSKDSTIRRCNCLQFSQIAPLESPESPEWVRLSSTFPVPLHRPHTLAVGKKLFLFGVEDLSSKSNSLPATFAFTYDLETSEWSCIADPVSSDWYLLGLFSWARWEDEEKVDTLIVVLKEFSVKKPLYSMRDKLRLRSYNARENRWEFFSYIDCSEYLGVQQFLVGNDYLFHIRGAKWRVFSLKQKKSNGFVQGLESLLELPGVFLLSDGSSDGFTGVARLNPDSHLPASCLKFCVSWISSMHLLNFAVVGIKNQEEEFFGDIVSFGSVKLDRSYYFGQCIGFCPRRDTESETSSSETRSSLGKGKLRVNRLKEKMSAHTHRSRLNSLFRSRELELDMARGEEDGSRQINFGKGSFV